MEFTAACRAIDGFIFDYQVPAALPALIRIVTCLAILFSFAIRFHDIWQFLQPNGIFCYADFLQTSKKFRQISATNLFPHSKTWAACILLTLYVAGILATVGCATNASIVVFLICVVSVQSRTFVIMFSGGDSVARTLLFFLAFMDSSACLSIDSIWRTEHPAVVSGWGIRVIQLYVCAIYFWSSIHKLSCTNWAQGKAVENAVKSPTWSRNPHSPLLRYPFVLQVTTISTLFFEFLAPIALFINELSAVWMFGGFALHAGVWACLRIGYFSPLMMAALLSFSAPVITYFFPYH